jgi:hypothetical protein
MIIVIKYRLLNYYCISTLINICKELPGYESAKNIGRSAPQTGITFLIRDHSLFMTGGGLAKFN